MSETPLFSFQWGTACLGGTGAPWGPPSLMGGLGFRNIYENPDTHRFYLIHNWSGIINCAP